MCVCVCGVCVCVCVCMCVCVHDQVRLNYTEKIFEFYIYLNRRDIKLSYDFLTFPYFHCLSCIYECVNVSMEIKIISLSLSYGEIIRFLS